MALVTLFYDADCGFCQRSVDWLMAKSRAGTFEAVPYQDEKRMGQYPMVNRALADRGIQALGEDGKLWRKASATGFCLTLVPGWEWLGRLVLCPAIFPFASIGYALVALNRQRISRWVGLDSCRISGSRQR